MSPNQIRALSSLGILIALVLCVFYLIRTYQAGNPRWYFLIMAMGILMMFSYQLMGKKRRK